VAIARQRSGCQSLSGVDAPTCSTANAPRGGSNGSEGPAGHCDGAYCGAGGPSTSRATMSPHERGTSGYGISRSIGQFLCAGLSPSNATIQRARIAAASHA
jgi:hypothetical protein